MEFSLTPQAIEFGALVLAIVALVFAGKQAIDAKRHTRTLNNQTKALTQVTDSLDGQTKIINSISESLSTRYLGVFPEYLPHVQTLLTRVQDELLVACTIPIQGVFNSPRGWLAVRHELEHLLQSREKKVIVRAIFTDAVRRKAFLEDQFKDAISDWSNWSCEAPNRDKLEELIRKLPGGKTAIDFNGEKLVELIERYADEDIRTAYQGAEIYEIDRRYPFNIWIRDGREGIFAISTTTPSFVNHAFLTSDTRLIQAFVDMHREMQKQSKEKVTMTASGQAPQS